jgi:hypothetical protein
MPDRSFISRRLPFAKPRRLTRSGAADSLRRRMTEVTRSRFGAAAICAGVLVLWVVLGGGREWASLVAGVAVAAALGIWASQVDL